MLDAMNTSYQSINADKLRNNGIITAPIAIILSIPILAFEISCDTGVTPTVGVVHRERHVVPSIDQPNRPDTQPVYVIIGAYVALQHEARDYSQDLVVFKIHEY